MDCYQNIVLTRLIYGLISTDLIIEISSCRSVVTFSERIALQLSPEKLDGEGSTDAVDEEKCK